MTWDMRMAIAVKACAQTIIDESGYPKKVTKRKILINVPELWRLERYKAPLTSLALQEVVETPETFALRRIQWFVHKCQQERSQPKRKEFIRSVNIDHVLHIPSIMHAFDEAMDALSSTKCS